MRINAKIGWQTAYYDGADAGEGLAIFLSQQNDSVTRYHCIVKAQTDQGQLTVGEFFTSPPNATEPFGQPTRQVAYAVCPGAKSWIVETQNANKLLDSETADDSADIILVSSKCCTAPCGVHRVSERWVYNAGVGGTYTVLPGQSILSLGVVSGAIAGSVQIGGGAAPVITVPLVTGMELEPHSQLLRNTVITFTDVTWVIELAESA